MVMRQADQPEHSLDVTAVAMIVALVLVIGPAAIVASVLVLTHGFDLAATTTFEGIATVIVSLLALTMIRAGVRELRGGLGVRVDARGVHRRKLSFAWEQLHDFILAMTNRRRERPAAQFEDSV